MCSPRCSGRGPCQLSSAFARGRETGEREREHVIPSQKKSAPLPAGVGAVACPRSVGSRRAPGCASNARATGRQVWLNTQARIESRSTALPTSRAALQTSRSRGGLPAQWAYWLRDRPAQTQNYSPTRIQAHFVSSFSSARDRPEGGTPDGDALCIAWESSTPDGTHVAAPDPDDEQDRSTQVGEGWARDH